MPIEISPIVQVSSREAFANTLKSDYQVNRWFLYIIQQPEASEELRKIKEAEKSLSKLKTLVLIQQINFLAAALWMIWAMFSSNKWLSVSGFIVLTAGLFMISKMKTRLVQEVGLYMLQRDFPEKSIEKYTLYEVGEFYSRKYKITALIDKLNKTAVIYRIVVASSLLIGVFFFSLKFVQLFLFVLLALFVTRLFVNSDFFYKRLS